MSIYNLKSIIPVAKVFAKLKTILLNAKEPIIDFTLSTVRHIVKNMKGKSNV